MEALSMAVVLFALAVGDEDFDALPDNSSRVYPNIGSVCALT